MGTSPDSPRRPLGSLPITCSWCSSCQAQGCPSRGAAFDDTGAHTAPLVFTRRSLLRTSAVSAGAAGLLAAGIGAHAYAQDATADATATDATATLACATLTAERTEGPYYVEDALVRDDITEGRPGIPLKLQITVMDIVACAPLDNGAVDIWHCDASGTYSGVSGGMGNDDTTGQTFLRGIQLTGTDGVAEITTMYPGWYQGRCTHIHLKVHVGGTAEDGTYEGGTVAHTGQLFFDDAITDEVAQVEPYASRGVVRTRNEEDGVLANGFNEPGFFLTLTRIDEHDITAGFVGTVTLGVDPSAISEETGGGGGNGGPGGPPPGGD
jgi:protocatechuate 3,4-dioxygenase beta subunit